MNSGNVRARLLATTIIAGALTAAPAFAQTAPPDAATATTSAAAASAVAADANSSGEIVVTGSRIASPTLTSGAPLQVVDSKAIQSTGAANLQDVLQQSPVVSSPALSRTNSNFLTSGGGVATVDLRNLGVSRTLVLVDGRRFVSGVPNNQAVDLNSIPTSFIDHVEIVSGGESAIYGSDAVAGVVNIIYKKNFSGVEGNVQTGVSQYGDDSTRQANLTIGGNLGDNRGNVMVYAGYSRDGTVMSADRNRTAIDQSSLGAETGDINTLFQIDRPVRSSYIPQGTFFCGDSICNGTDGAILGDGSPYPPTQAQKFNRQSYRYIAVPVERYLFASRANYEISPAANLFLETTFAKSHVHQQLEPAPADTYSTGTGIFAAEAGQYPIEQLVNGSLFVNPLIPGYIDNIADDSNGDGLRDIAWSRRLTDLGPRTYTSDRNTYRVVAGVEGDISPKWHYDAYFNYGRTDDNDTGTGQYNLANFRNALVVIPGVASDPGAVLAPNGQYVICANADARAEGCVPANVYGANTLDPRSAAYIQAPSTYNAFAQQIETGANITGHLGDLWGAGPIGIAAGVEYRKESSSVQYDALTQTGQNGGNKLPNTSGSFDVVEGYGEIHVPIITDKPFFKNLEARAAGRVSHYSTIGTVYSYNAGGIYSPIPDVTFRGSVALSTRAPNVGELFQGLSQTFPTGLNDPCVGIGTSGGGALGDNCRAASGVLANINANGGTFKQTQSDQQGISGFDGGNPNLKQEKGRTLTFGMVISPKSIEALRNFSFTVDYTRTKVTGAITATDRQIILNQCYQDGNPAYCQFITRRPAQIGTNSAGSLQFINRGVVNSGGILTSAIDATASYKQNLGSYGSLNTTVSYTHLLKGWEKDFPGADKNYFAGEVGAPKDHFLATVDWQIGPVTFEYRGSYIGRTYLDDQFVLGLTDHNVQIGTDASGNPIYQPITNRHDKRARIGAYYIQDLQVNMDAGDHFNFYLGVNNLLNISPPPIYSNLPGDTTGAETDASDYDAIGRTFYAGARFRF